MRDKTAGSYAALAAKSIAVTGNNPLPSWADDPRACVIKVAVRSISTRRLHPRHQGL